MDIPRFRESAVLAEPPVACSSSMARGLTVVPGDDAAHDAGSLFVGAGVLTPSTGMRGTFARQLRCCLRAGASDVVPPRSAARLLQVRYLCVEPDATTTRGQDDKAEKERKRLDKIKNLRSELKRGYFWEFEEIKTKKGKVFEADKQLIPSDRAPMFPSFEAESLLGEVQQADKLLLGKDQVTLVALSFRDSGFKMLPSWITPFEQEFQGKPKAKVLQVSMEDKTWLKLLKYVVVRGQQSAVDITKHGQTFLRFGDTMAVRNGLAIENRLVGYVFLVDGQGRARWRATGEATEAEVAVMLTCARELLTQDGLQAKSESTQRRRR